MARVSQGGRRQGRGGDGVWSCVLVLLLLEEDEDGRVGRVREVKRMGQERCDWRCSRRVVILVWTVRIWSGGCDCSGDEVEKEDVVLIFAKSSSVLSSWRSWV